LYNKRSVPSQQQIKHFSPIAFAPRKNFSFKKIPEIPGVPLKAVQAILVSVDSQTIDSFVCTQKFLAKEYGCVRRTTTRLFKKMISEGFLEVLWDQNYSAGQLRVFRIGAAYRQEIESYLSNFTPGDINVAECPTYDELPELTPTFSTGLTFEEEFEALSELSEKNEKPPNNDCMYPSRAAAKLPVTPLSFETAKIYADDYLGYFRDFNEKKRCVKLLGEAVDSKGLEFVDELMMDLSRNIRDVDQRRVKLTDYLARIKRE